MYNIFVRLRGPRKLWYILIYKYKYYLCYVINYIKYIVIIIYLCI